VGAKVSDDSSHFKLVVRTQLEAQFAVEPFKSRKQLRLDLLRGYVAACNELLDRELEGR
jgi:hypothetical protein